MIYIYITPQVQLVQLCVGLEHGFPAWEAGALTRIFSLQSQSTLTSWPPLHIEALKVQYQ